MLFKQEKTKAKRAYVVENLNPSKGISASMKVLEDSRSVVCLCLVDRTIKTTFPDEESGLSQLRKYRQLYKEIKKDKL